MNHWSCEIHDDAVVSTMVEARAMVAAIREEFSPETAALMAHAVSFAEPPDCPAAGYARFLMAAAWREI